MSETSKQYVQLLNGKWIKDAEARRDITNLKYNSQTILLDTQSSQANLMAAVQGHTAFGTALVYKYETEIEGHTIVDDCIFIGTVDWDGSNTAYFFNPRNKAILAAQYGETGAPLSVSSVPLATLEKVEELTEKVGGLETSAKLNLLNESSTIQDFETAYHDFVSKGISFIYLVGEDSEQEACPYCGSDYNGGNFPIFYFLRVGTREIITIDFDDASGAQVATSAPIVSVVYDASTEEMTISNSLVELE